MRDTARPPGGRGPVQGAAFSWPPLEGMEAPAGLPAHAGLPFTLPAPAALGFRRPSSRGRKALAPRAWPLPGIWIWCQLLGGGGEDRSPAADRAASRSWGSLLRLSSASGSWSYTKPWAFVVLRCKGHIWGQAGQVHDHFCFALSPASSLQRPESSWPNQTVYSGRSTALPAPRTVWARTGSRALTCTGGQSPRQHDVGVATL